MTALATRARTVTGAHALTSASGARPGAHALTSASGACIQPRTFETRRQVRGAAPQAISLAGIRDRVAHQTRHQDPRDLERTPSQLCLEWDAQINRATLRVLGGTPDWMAGDSWLQSSTAFDGLDDFDATERLVFTRTGLRAYVREVYGGHAMGLLDRLVAASRDGGAKVATMAGALLSRKLNDRVLQLRTVLTRDPVSGGIVRAVRGVFRGYTSYDDLAFLNDLIDCPDTRSLPVLQYRRGDDGMQVRFSLDPIAEVTAKGPTEPTPIVDAWNSETGRASTSLQSGIWKLVCLNGMMGLVPGAIWRWRHAGNVQRVRDGVPQAVAEIRNVATGLVDAYNDAVDVAIDDAFAWMRAALADEKVGGDTIDAFGAALNHETTTPGRMLASTVDAMTWVAQHEIDQFRQREIEEMAVRVMARGLDEARRSSDGRLRAPLAA
jgi:hypothetical protein